MQLLHSIRLLVAQYLGVQLRSLAVMDERDRFVWFIQPMRADDESHRRAEAFLKGTLEVIQGACRESLGASISFVLSGEPVSWQDMSGKYYELLELMNYRVNGLDMLLVDTEFEANILRPAIQPELEQAEAEAQPLEAQLRHRSLDQLDLCLERGDRERFLEALLPITNTLRAIRSKNSNLAIEAYGRVSLGLLGYVNRWKLTEQLAFHIGQNKLMRIDAFDTWAEAADYLIELADILFRLREEGSARRADNAVEQIQRHIQLHLDEDLSLVRLAEQVRLNPSYLSRLYKQVAGANLSDFIDAARMDRARRLLQCADVKINEVARQVGYETAASFTRFFRKQTGMSPQEYRDGKQRQTT
jgi:two-component system response regulator YesN